MEELILSVHGLDLFLAQTGLLRVAPFISHLEQQGAQQSCYAKGQAESEARIILRLLAVQVHIGADNAANIADADVEGNADGASTGRCEVVGCPG
jgi:hypothetical protein